MMKRSRWIAAAGISLLLLAACGTNNGPPTLPPETAATVESQAVTTAQTEANMIPETKEAEAVTEPTPEAKMTAVQTEASTEATEPTESKAPTPRVQPPEPPPAARTESQIPAQPPKPSEPSKTTAPPKATEPKATDPPKTSEPSKPSENPKPAEAPAPSEPPASTEEAAQPTEAPAEPPKSSIDISALEAYGNQYAESIGFSIDYSMTTGNSGFFPTGMAILNSMEEGYKLVREEVACTKEYLIAYVGNIDGARARVIVGINRDGWHTVTVLYG